MKRRNSRPVIDSPSRTGVEWDDNEGMNRYRAASARWVAANPNATEWRRQAALSILAADCGVTNQVAGEIFNPTNKGHTI